MDSYISKHMKLFKEANLTMLSTIEERGIEIIKLT